MADIDLDKAKLLGVRVCGDDPEQGPSIDSDNSKSRIPAALGLKGGWQPSKRQG